MFIYINTNNNIYIDINIVYIKNNISSCGFRRRMVQALVRLKKQARLA